MTGSSSGPVPRSAGRWPSACRSRWPALSGPSGAGRAWRACAEAIGDPVAVEGLRGTAAGPARVAPLGGGRGPLPRLRELHAGLPDLLLHEREPAVRPRRRRLRRRAELGLLLLGRLRQGRRRQLPVAPRGPLPAVADPQVRDLGRPVRNVRLRGLRPLHHLVPGRHRRPRGARGDRQPAAGPRSARRPPSRRARCLCDRPGSSASSAETADTTTLVCRDVDPLIAAGRARPVRDGDPAGPPGRADLGLALPPRRRLDRAVDPGGGTRDRDPRPAGARRRARPARSARAGLARRGRRGPRRRSSWPAGSACRRCARSSTSCSPGATGSARCACTTGRGRRPIGRTSAGPRRRGLAGVTSSWR